MSSGKNINPNLILVQPRKTRLYITERLLMGCKESNQTNKNQRYINVSGSRKSRSGDSRPASDEEYDTADNWSTASVISEDPDQSGSIPEEGTVKPVLSGLSKID